MAAVTCAVTLSLPLPLLPSGVFWPFRPTPSFGLRLSFLSLPNTVVRRHRSAGLQCCAFLNEAENSKHSLLRAVRETERGFASSSEQRALVEEAVVALEAYGTGESLDLNKLDGTWLLQYTTASDVLSILRAAQLPFLEVGQIYQKFECRNGVDSGLVRNVVRWSVPRVLQEGDGATLTVTAKFFVASARNIVLRFEEAAVGSLMASEELQAFLAPAFLPRTFLNLEILQFIRGFNASIPLKSNDDVSNYVQRAPPGLLYYISFLDNELLLGRAIGSGGIFIFTRTQALQSF